MSSIEVSVAPSSVEANAPDCVICGARFVRPFARVSDQQYWRCLKCSGTFLEPSARLDREGERAEYERHENDPQDPGYRAFLGQLTTQLLPHLQPQARGLDYGCGPGPALSAILEEEGLEVHDYDPLFAPDESLLIRRYDFVTCTEVVEHFYSPQRQFRRLNAILKRGGWLGVMTNLLEDDAGFSQWHYRRERTHVVFYKRETFDLIGYRLGWKAYYPAPRIVLFQKKA